jgi:HD superfamily phosphohydrolase
MSTKILHNILDTQGIDPDTSKENEQFDVKLIESIINKKNNKQDNYINAYQQLVTNTSNGINADIFDYLRRDSYKFGFPQQSFEFQILLDNSLVIDNDICYRAQDAYSVYDLFMSKFLMSKKFYLHRVEKGIELMIKDVFIESNSYFNYLNYINDLGLYTKFNDSILNYIYHHKSKKLEKAKQIIDNIYKRNFYTFVGEYDSTDLKKNFDTFNEETLLKYTSSKEEPLQKEEIRVLKLKLNLGENEKDPMDNVFFYDTNLNKIKYKSEEISHLLPNKYQENIIRVYLTTNNRQKLNSAQQALINYCKEIKTAPILYKSEKKNTGHILEYKFDSNLIRSSLDLFSKID